MATRSNNGLAKNTQYVAKVMKKKCESEMKVLTIIAVKINDLVDEEAKRR